MTTDEQFNEIIQAAISKGSSIECSLEEYIDQMEAWISEIEICVTAAEEDIRRRDQAAQRRSSHD